MTTWILILVMAGSFGGTSDHIEFNTLEACHMARKQLLEEAPAASKLVMCVKKG